MPGRAAHSREELPSIGSRLAEIRKDRGISQVEFAQRLGVTQAAVSDYERGVSRLTAPMLLRITQVLGVSADEILGLKNGKRRSLRVSRKVLRRAEQIEALPPQDRRALLRTLDAFLKTGNA